MSRELIKVKLATQGLDLRDNNCIYKGEELIARDVRLIDSNPNDCIAFEFDVLVEGVINMPMTPVTLH